MQWTEAGVEGASRFQQRVWRLVGDTVALRAQSEDLAPVAADEEAMALRRAAHRAVQQVADDIEGLRFNRAVAQIYELTNALVRSSGLVSAAPAARLAALDEGVGYLVQLIAPMMPHLAETCWQALGRDGLVADAPWPQVDPALLVDNDVVMPIQVNGKRRGEITVAKGTAPAEIERMVLSLEAIARMLDGKTPRKIVVVPDRIVNVVV